MKNGFAGFSAEGIKFLRQLKKNNDREWFQPRKETFDAELKAPMIALVTALQRTIEAQFPDYMRDPAKCVFRIYRDTRFSKDKTPYKTNISATIQKAGGSKGGGAVFYFQVSPDDTLMASGSYMPSPDELRMLRSYLMEHHVEFEKICSAPKLKAALGELHGEQLIRVPKGFDPEHPAAELLRRKQFIFHQNLDPALVTTPELYTRLSQALIAAMPFMEFLNRPLAAMAKADESRYLH